MKYHLAQVNLAYARGTTDDPVMQVFHDHIDEINAQSERSPGFVWRFVTDSRDPLDRLFDDPLILFNMSVWEDIEALHHFTYKTVHAELYAGRRQWFDDWKARAGPLLHSGQFAMWWLPAGQLPTVEEAKQKLRLISECGPTPLAFHFKMRFTPEESIMSRMAASLDEDEVRRPITKDVVATLVENHRTFLDFLTRRVGDRALAEDLLQEAFVRGLDRIESVRDGESIVAWFYRSLRNAVIDHHRRQGATARRLEQLHHEMELATEPDAALQQSVCKCVARLADTLKPEYAIALKRIEVDGLSVQAFAEEAGVTSSNAAVRVFRARQALRKQVSMTCGTCAEHGCLDCHCGSGSC